MAKRLRAPESRSSSQPARSNSKASATAATEVRVWQTYQPPSAPAAEAVSTYERAMQALQRHDYQRAAASFRQLIESFPGERALLDRSRVYLDLCQRELERQPRAPETLEERLTAATAALNVNDDREAERLAGLVLGEDPQRELAVYLLAVIEARRGNTEQALSRLSEAIAISPDVRAQALHDEDFATLRDSADFHRLTEIPDESPARRARPGRAER